MKITLALIEALIVIISILLSNLTIINLIDYAQKEVKKDDIKNMLIMIFIVSLLVASKYYLELTQL